MAHVEFQKNAKVSPSLAPTTLGTETKTGSYLSMELAHHAAVIFAFGVIDADIAAKLVQAKDVGGTSSKDIVGKTQTVLAADGGKIFIIEVEGSELDVVNGFKTIAGVVTGTGATSYVGIAIIRTPLRIGPASLVT